MGIKTNRQYGKEKIEVQGLTIHLETIEHKDYVSLTDIAKKSSKAKPAHILQNWMKNSNTIRYLLTWEEIHNPDVKVIHMDDHLIKSTDNRIIISPKEWISNSHNFLLSSGIIKCTKILWQAKR